MLGLLSLLEPQYRWTSKNFFNYSGSFLPLTASLTLQTTLGIASDTDFIATFASAISTDATNLILDAFIAQLVQWSDTASGYNYFLAPTHAELVYGSGGTPGVMAIPMILTRGTQLQVQHQNLAAVNKNVYFSIFGFKSRPGTDTRNPDWQRR